MDEGDQGMRLAPRNRAARAASKLRAGSDAKQASLTIRVDFGPYGYLGPGKIQLMGLILKHGSIRSAGKEMGMSYRRAWLLVDEINKIFRTPLVEKQMGGAGGGGAKLSDLGQEVLQRFRAIELASAKANAADLAALRSSLASQPASPPKTRGR